MYAEDFSVVKNHLDSCQESGIRNVILDSLSDGSGDTYQMVHFQCSQRLENWYVGASM